MITSDACFNTFNHLLLQHAQLGETRLCFLPRRLIGGVDHIEEIADLRKHGFHIDAFRRPQSGKHRIDAFHSLLLLGVTVGFKLFKLLLFSTQRILKAAGAGQQFCYLKLQINLSRNIRRCGSTSTPRVNLELKLITIVLSPAVSRGISPWFNLGPFLVTMPGASDALSSESGSNLRSSKVNRPPVDSLVGACSLRLSSTPSSVLVNRLTTLPASSVSPSAAQRSPRQVVVNIHGRLWVIWYFGIRHAAGPAITNSVLGLKQRWLVIKLKTIFCCKVVMLSSTRRSAPWC